MTSFRAFLFVLILSTVVFAQGDPAAKEDQEADRQKLLRAVDQLDTMSTQIDAIKGANDQQKADIESLKTQLVDSKTENTQLKNDIATLKAAIEKLDASRAEERDVLLKKVGEIVAEALKNKPAPAPPEVSPPPPAPATPTAPSSSNTPEDGFFYVVKKGDNLHGIAAAYQDQGFKVTVEDIRKANKMSKTAYIFAGQKLFIPKK